MSLGQSLKTVVVLFASVLGLIPIQAQVVWSAFNGIGYSVSNDATYWDNDNEGALKNFATGETLEVSVSLSETNILTYLDGGLDLDYAEGTDAYERFSGSDWINPTFVQSYDDSSIPFEQVITFSNLNPNWTYEFYATANRGGSGYVGDARRETQFTILGASSTPDNAHSDGVEIAGSSAILNAGYNSITGSVVGWENIAPNPDGTFSISITSVHNAISDDYKAYSFQMFQLNAIAAVPEPATYAVGLGLIALGAARMRRAKRGASTP